MKKITIIFLMFFVANFSFAQVQQSKEVVTTTYPVEVKKKSGAEAVLAMYNACKCNEIVIVAKEHEKGYSGTWLLHIEAVDGFLSFSKDEYTHSWDLNDIIWVEKAGYRLRVFLSK